MSWNGLTPSLREAVSLSIFKKNILKIIRPVKKSFFNIQNTDGIRWIFQLRVGLSPLKSHKISHNFQDTTDDLCGCSLNAETTLHFLLKCPNYNIQRNILFQIVNPILTLYNLNNINDVELVRVLLYGDIKFKFHENQSLLKETINFIDKTLRFSPI